MIGVAGCVVPDPPAVIAAVAASLANFASAVGRAEGGQLHRESRATWFMSGAPVPLLNGILSSELTPELLTHEALRLVRRFQGMGVPFRWWVGPDPQVMGLADPLGGLGVERLESAIGMAAPLFESSQRIPEVPGLLVERVRDRQGLRIFANVLRRGELGGSESEEHELVRVFASTLASSSTASTLLLGLQDGRPVGCAKLDFGTEHASLSCIATVPESRRQGVASTLIVGAMREAAAARKSFLVVLSNAASVSLARKLGFAEYCAYDVYEWRPVPMAAPAPVALL